MASPYRTKNYKRLSTINLTITILGSLLILSFLGVYLISTYRASMQNEKENLRVLTATAASKSQNLFASLLVTLQLLDNRIMENPDKDPRFDPVFNRLVELYRNSTGRRIDLRMVTKDGGLFYLPSKSLTPLANVSEREYFTVQRDTPNGSLYFAAPVKSQVTGKWGIPVSYRLHDNKFGILVIFAAIEFHDLDDVFAEILTYPDRAVTLIRDDRLVLERSPFNQYIIGRRFPYAPTRRAKGPSKYSRPRSKKDRSVTESLTTCPSTSWSATVPAGSIAHGLRKPSGRPPRPCSFSWRSCSST